MCYPLAGDEKIFRLNRSIQQRQVLPKVHSGFKLTINVVFVKLDLPVARLSRARRGKVTQGKAETYFTLLLCLM